MDQQGVPEPAEDSTSTSQSETKESTLSSGSSLDTVSHSDGDIENPNPEKVIDEKLRVGRFSTLMNVLNCMIGAGILSVPSTLGESGIIVSIILLIFIAWITHVATTLCYKLQAQTDAEGLEDIAQKVLGNWGCITLGIMNIVFNVSAMLAYLVLGGDFIVSFFAAGGINVDTSLYRAIIVFIYSLLIPIALSIPRSMKFLSYFSTLVMVVVVFYCIVMMVKIGIFVPKDGVSKSIVLATINLQFFSSISIYCLSFALPICVLPVIYYYNPSVPKRSSVTALAMIICTFVTAFPSILAYLIFGADCNGNILNSFSPNDILILIVRAGFFLIVSFSYPITHPCVSCAWSQFIFKENQANNLKGWRRVAVLFLSNIIPLVLALFLPQMKPALEVGGAFGGCLGNFAFPGLMWFVFSKDRWFHWKNIMALLLLLFGVVCAAIATYMGVVSAIDAFKTVHF